MRAEGLQPNAQTFGAAARAHPGGLRHVVVVGARDAAQPGPPPGDPTRLRRALTFEGEIGAEFSAEGQPVLEPGGALQWYTPALEDGRTHVTASVATAKATLTRIATDNASHHAASTSSWKG